MEWIGLIRPEKSELNPKNWKKYSWSTNTEAAALFLLGKDRSLLLAPI